MDMFQILIWYKHKTNQGDDQAGWGVIARENMGEVDGDNLQEMGTVILYDHVGTSDLIVSYVMWQSCNATCSPARSFNKST